MTDSTKLEALLESTNVAKTLDKDKLTKIGQDAKKGFEADLASRHEWEKCMEEWTKLAKQVAETKTYPWKDASNVKYPLLSTAAMQFAARAYPSLVPSDRRVVKALPIGKDPDGSKYNMAEAISVYMSYQIMDEMDGWEEDMDKLLIMLPIVGVMFKKTYWDSVKKVNCSRLVLPKNLVVDYWARSLCDAERISEIIQLSPRKVKERQQSDIWLDVDLGTPPMPTDAKGSVANDSTTPYTFIEQHTFLDLDDDDYEEPYIVTFHKETGKVVRIVARFDHKTTFQDDDGKLQKIEPIQYYTKFGFVPNPDGSFYDIGFGVLLGPLNESVNTLINLLIDSGHLASLQGGFLGKGLRLRMGETKFIPGEWKAVNATGSDLKQQILPLPTKEPSNVLFQLMGSLITSGKELASVAEIFVGKMPGQNTPATTTMATIEQGMKVFTAVYKRIFRSLSEEYAKLRRLNSIYLDPQTEVALVGMSVGPDDFNGDTTKIFPGADPTAVSQTERLLKAQGLMELMQVPGILDPVKVVQRILEAQEQPNWQELLNPQVAQTGQAPQPPPDPRVQALQMKAQTDQAAGQQNMQINAQKAQLDAADKTQQMQMKQQAAVVDLAMKQKEMELKSQSQAHMDQAKIDQAAQAHAHDMAQQAQKHQQEIVQQAHKHAQSIRQAEEAHRQKLHAIRQQAKATPKGPTTK